MRDVGALGCGSPVWVQYITSGFVAAFPGSNGGNIRVTVIGISGLPGSLCQVVESETRASHPIKGVVRPALGVPSATQAPAQ